MSAHIRFILFTWLLIAPVASNLLRFGGGDPLVQLEMQQGTRTQPTSDRAYLGGAATVGLRDLIDPTRILFLIALTLLLLPLVIKREVIRPDRSERWMLVFSVILLVNVVTQSWRLTYGLRVAADASDVWPSMLLSLRFLTV